MNEFESIDEQLDAIRRLSGARWVAVQWETDGGQWRRHVRGREDMLPQSRERFFDDLLAVVTAAGDQPEQWQAFLQAWRAPHGLWQSFRISGTAPAVYAVLSEQDQEARRRLEECRGWIDIALRAITASAAEHERTQAGFERQQSVLESAASLLSAVSELDVIPRGLSLATRLVNADGGAYYELDGDAGCLVPRDVRAEEPLADALRRMTDLETGICGMAARSGSAKSFKSGDPQTHWPVRAGVAISAAVAVPVVGHEGLQGVLCVVRGSGGPFDELDVNTLTLFTRQLAGVMENLRLLARLRAANRELSQTQAQLVESARLHTLGEMAAGVAHDFNNVLGALLGRVQLLQYRVSDATVLDGLSKIEKLIIEGEATVRRLQEAARVRKTPDVQPQTLDALLREVYSAAEHALRNQAQIHDRKLTWSTEFKPAGPFADGGHLGAALRQFLTELGESVPEGTAIGLHTGRDEVAGWIRISLDYPPEFRWRWEESEALSSLRVAAATYDGTITASTAAPGLAQLSIQFGRDEHLQTTPDGKPRKYRVLVIDDDDEVRDVLEELLRIDGHQVTVAADGAQALNVFAPGKFDLVFTDLGMPGVSGWQVAESIKRDAPSMPVVMVTGWGAQLDPDKVRQSGIDRVLTKPFQWLSVLQALNELAGGRGSAQKPAR
jgi:CheY-like chemotaxis protein/GAF domain-containing protein